MYGIGVIGLGVMGRRMVDALAADPRFRVIAGFDPNPPSGLGDLDIRHDPAAIIDDPAIDCIYIASPPASHARLVAAAAAAGKAIFCEKPLVVDPAEAEPCVKAVREAGVPAAVNFPFATAPAAVRLAELVRGDLGEIQAAKLTLRFAHWPRGWQANASGWLAKPEQGGFMREVGSHFLFLAHRLFGAGRQGETVIARGPAGTETRVQAAIHYPSVTLHIDGSVEGEAEDFNRFEVIGRQDSAALTDWYRLEHGGALSERRPSLPRQLDGLARLLAGDTAQPLATFEEAAAVAILVERLLKG